MSATTITRFVHEDIKPSIGSRILNSKEELLAGELAPQIRELLEQRGVLVFPKIDFTDEEQIAFTKTLARELARKGMEPFKKTGGFPKSLLVK